MKAGMMGGRIIRMTTSTRMTMRTITRMTTTMKISMMTIMTVMDTESSMLSPTQICPLYPVSFVPFDVVRYSCQRRLIPTTVPSYKHFEKQIKF